MATATLARKPRTPSPNGSSRPTTFKVGNAGGPGNPFQKVIQKLRARVFKVVTEERLDNVIEATLTLAEQGEEWAVHEILNRTIGKVRDSEENSGPNGPIAILQQFNTWMLRAPEGPRPVELIEIEQIAERGGEE